MIPEEYLDHVIETYTQGKFEQEVRKARSDFFQMTGTAFEEDPFYEERLDLFLEWYIFTRPLAAYDLPPVKLFYLEKEKELSDEERAVYHGFTQNVHSLYQLKKVRGDNLVLEDLFTGKQVTVVEKKSMMTVGDVFEARLVPYHGTYYFGKGFCFHPPQTKSFIVKCINKIKHLDEDFKNKLLLDLAQMKLKHDRYPHIDVKYIYSFEARI